MIQSNRSGVGKTLYVKRLKQTLLKNQRRQTKDDVLVTVSLHSKIVDHSKVMKIFMGSKMTDAVNGFRIFHIDVAPEVIAETLCSRFMTKNYFYLNKFISGKFACDFINCYMKIMNM